MNRKKIIYPVIALLFLLSFSSCQINRKAIPTAPINAQVNLSMSDLEFVGEVTGTAEQSFFIGIPLGGRRFHQGVATAQGPFGPGTIPLNRGAQNALYDALMQKPNADFLLPISVQSTRDVMFLGSTVTYTVRAKAFRIKQK